MATLEELRDRARQMIAENPEEAKKIGGIYKFVLHGDGGGTLVVNLTGVPDVTDADHVAVNCTVKMAMKDFVDTAEGRVDSRALFFSGKLRVEGNFAMALKLKKLLVKLTNMAPAATGSPAGPTKAGGASA